MGRNVDPLQAGLALTPTARIEKCSECDRVLRPRDKRQVLRHQLLQVAWVQTVRVSIFPYRTHDLFCTPHSEMPLNRVVHESNSKNGYRDSCTHRSDCQPRF